MSKVVVVIFPSEAAAYEGTRALRQLHSEGTLTLYGMAVLFREASGNLTIKQAVDEGPLGFAVGTLMGGLIGLIGGPAGAAIGMATGALAGGLGDIIDIGVRSDFIDAVSTKLNPGKAAVVAEIAEDWTAPLDMRMGPLGGEVVREWRSEFEAEQIEKLARERRAEFAALKEEFDRAGADAKSTLKRRLEATRAKLEAVEGRAEALQRQFEQEAEAKRKELREQLATAKKETKGEIEKRMKTAEADIKWRSELLKRAWSLTKEALAA
jgi:uncharacterized membrane protein